MELHYIVIVLITGMSVLQSSSFLLEISENLADDSNVHVLPLSGQTTTEENFSRKHNDTREAIARDHCDMPPLFQLLPERSKQNSIEKGAPITYEGEGF